MSKGKNTGDGVGEGAGYGAGEGDGTGADYGARHHDFEGCFNFRDIGGYPAGDGRQVKWGKYYRAGRQNFMTLADERRAARLGIKTQIDLRQLGEIVVDGRGPLPEMGASYHHIPVIPDGGSDKLNQLVGDTGISGRRYLGYLEFGPDAWLEIFALFASADSLPLVIHCTAGKDRTGIATAFLLSVLGVSRELIEADYHMTNHDVPRLVDFVEASRGLPDGMDRQALTQVASVPQGALGDFLDGLDTRWGGPLAYLREIGITETRMNAIRNAFLE